MQSKCSFSSFTSSAAHLTENTKYQYATASHCLQPEVHKQNARHPPPTKIKQLSSHRSSGSQSIFPPRAPGRSNMCTFPGFWSVPIINKAQGLSTTNYNSSCSWSVTWVLLDVYHCPDASSQSCWRNAPPRWYSCGEDLKPRQIGPRRPSHQTNTTKVQMPLSSHDADPSVVARTAEQTAPLGKPQGRSQG